MSNIPKKPNDDILFYIRRTYIYDSEKGLIYGKSGLSVGSVDTSGKRQRVTLNVMNKNYKFHHVCWFLYYNEWPDVQIDHKDRDNFNNKINNLRKATDFEQQRNKDNSLSYKGFSIMKDASDKPRNKMWRARSQRQGVDLGRFYSSDEAREAVDKWCKERGLEGI